MQAVMRVMLQAPEVVEVRYAGAGVEVPRLIERPDERDIPWIPPAFQIAALAHGTVGGKPCSIRHPLPSMLIFEPGSLVRPT